MAGETPNYKAFNFTSAPGLLDIVQYFKLFPRLACPTTISPSDLFRLATIPPYTDKGKILIPVFTDPAMLTGTMETRPTLPFLKLLINAPTVDIFSFNPALSCAKTTTAEIRLNKNYLSAVIGFLEIMSSHEAFQPNEAGVLQAISSGHLYKAHYISTLMAAQPTGKPSTSRLQILLALGLFEDILNSLKDRTSPECSYYLATIHRRTGSSDKAKPWLSKIPDGTDLSRLRNMELAWLAYEENNPEEALRLFRDLASIPALKNEAEYGIGSALSKIALRSKDHKGMSEAVKFLSGLSKSSFFTPQALVLAGNILFKNGVFPEAEKLYREASLLEPAIQTKGNLCLALLKTGKNAEAAAIINDIALIDLPSAKRLAQQLPPQDAPKLLANAKHASVPGENTPLDAAIEPPQEAKITVSQKEPIAFKPDIIAGDPQSVSPAVKQDSPVQEKKEPQAAPKKQETFSETVRLEAARPKKVISSRTIRDPFAQPPSQTEALKSMDEPLDMPDISENDKQDEFIGRAFKFASDLEDEFNKKVYFNMNSLDDVERKLRSAFMEAKQNPNSATELVSNSAAFISYLLQERYKGRLIKFTGFDPWGWPMLFDKPKRFLTYPIYRTWQLMWMPTPPEPGWLTKYFQYVDMELKNDIVKPNGVAAIKVGAPSHIERVTDAIAEHKRIMDLASDLSETNNIELGRSGITKLELAIHRNYRPGIPPTTDGWKLLRCYGHILAEIMTKDLKATWYNVEGNDGLWSMRLPWKDFIFPLGKIYRTASHHDSLEAYYDMLMEEKLKHPR